MHEGSDLAMQAEGEKLWEAYLTALHSSHNESAAQHALLRSGMHSIAESLVVCRFKPLSGGAGATLLALETSLRQVLQRLLAKQRDRALPPWTGVAKEISSFRVWWLNSQPANTPS